jgi:hypothetical protein
MAPTYPWIPKTTAHLRPGQFWSIPLSDGRFGSGRVLRVDTDRATGGRTRFIGAILDWVGDRPRRPRRSRESRCWRLATPTSG